MGQCQTQFEDFAAQHVHRKPSKPRKPSSSSTKTRGNQSLSPGPRKPKIEDTNGSMTPYAHRSSKVGSSDCNPMSPSEQTTSTIPETPSPFTSPTSSTLGDTLEPSDTVESSDAVESSEISDQAQQAQSLVQEQQLHQDDEEYDDEILGAMMGERHSLVSFVPSLRYTEDLEGVIPEEVDPDAPSDEEEEHQKVFRRDWDKMEPGHLGKQRFGRKGSPPRPQSQIKLKHRKTTNPNSVVHHGPSKVVQSGDGSPPSPGSVESHTISQFNKLKVQVKLAARRERIRRRASKLEDRFQDVQGYRNLWKDFEQIQNYVADVPPAVPHSKMERRRSFDLKNTKTWYFDFQALDEDVDDDDNKSQSGLSLHSSASLEYQKRLFAEKRRTRRRNSEPNVSKSFANDSTEKVSTNPVSLGADDNEKSESHSTRKSSKSKLNEPLSAPRTLYLKESRMLKDNSQTEIESSQVHPPNQEDNGVMEVDDTDATSVRSFVEDNDYGVKRKEDEVDETEHTPKASVRRRRMTPQHTIVEPPPPNDNDNDYQVPRRRRLKSLNLNAQGRRPLSVFKGESDSVGSQVSTPRPLEYVSDDDSSDLTGPQVSVLTLPSFDSVENPDSNVPRWRTFSNVKEKVVMGNAARCLEDVFLATSTTTNIAANGITNDIGAEVTLVEPPEISISHMTTEEFLRISDDHALVRVSRGHHANGYSRFNNGVRGEEVRRLDFDAIVIEKTNGLSHAPAKAEVTKSRLQDDNDEKDSVIGVDVPDDEIVINVNRKKSGRSTKKKRPKLTKPTATELDGPGDEY